MPKYSEKNSDEVKMPRTLRKLNFNKKLIKFSCYSVFFCLLSMRNTYWSSAISLNINVATATDDAPKNPPMKRPKMIINIVNI